MRRSMVWLGTGALALLTPLAPSANAHAARSVTKAYSMPQNWEVDPPLGLVGWETEMLSFTAARGESAVTIAVADVTQTATPFAVEQRGTPWFSHAYCGTTTLPVRPGQSVHVYVFGAFASAASNPPVCPGVATQGTVTATFH